MTVTRVLITDDHDIFRQGLVSIMENTDDIEVCGEAQDGREAIDLTEELLPDVVLMDINLPVVDGISATRIVTSKCPSVKVLILTVSADEENLFEAIKAGAHGYLVKTTTPAQLVDAIRAVFKDGTVVSPKLATNLVTEFRSLEEKVSGEGLSTVGGLTKREMDVLRLLAHGKSNKEIASELYISERTVKNHISNVLSKLHLENRVQAATYAVKKGLDR